MSTSRHPFKREETLAFFSNAAWIGFNTPRDRLCRGTNPQIDALVLSSDTNKLTNVVQRPFAVTQHNDMCFPPTLDRQGAETS